MHLRKPGDSGEQRTAEDEMARWHLRLNGRDSEQALEDGEGQGSLACCSPWSHKESDTTERLSNNNLNIPHMIF